MGRNLEGGCRDHNQGTLSSRHLSGEKEKKYDNTESMFGSRVWDLIPGPIKQKESLHSQLWRCVLVSVTSFGILGEGYVANHGLSCSRHRFVN
jgi:hypothetical protein